MLKKSIYLIVYFNLKINLFSANLYDYLYSINNSSNIRVEQNVLKRLVDGFRLEHQQNSLVRYYEKLYTRKPKIFQLLLRNATPYIYYILSQTEKNGLPSEIALIPGIESLYNPKAISNTNAFGLWQFMQGTGKRFQLNKYQNIDDRQNIVKSTIAAIKYFRYLYNIFGQWELAIGAYNCGEGNMYRSIMSSKYSRGNIDYYSLKLNKETINYLPKLIALASIIENPSKFNISFNEIDNVPYFALVKIKNDISIEDLLSQSKISKHNFFLLNPQYRYLDYILTKNQNILLPIENRNKYYLFNHIAIDQIQSLDEKNTDDPIYNFINTRDDDNNNDYLEDFINNNLDDNYSSQVRGESELDKLIKDLDN